MSNTNGTPASTYDARRLIKTSTPGIYRKQRRDGTPGSYVVVYRAGGRQRKESARTLAEARALRAARSADEARGEFHPRSKVTFRAFLTEWVDRYQGNGRRGFCEGTRAEYRRLLDHPRARFLLGAPAALGRDAPPPGRVRHLAR